MEIFLVGYLVSGVIFGFFCSYLADKKGHGGCAWFFLGFFFSFLALLVLIGLPSEREASSEQGSAPGQPTDSTGSPSPSPRPRNFRLCPHCIQEVHELANACPHCQRDLPEVERCSYEDCGKIINPTDNRCEDDKGNPFCNEPHMLVEHCTYKSCGKVIKPTDNRCEDDEGNPFCSRRHMWLAARSSTLPTTDVKTTKETHSATRSHMRVEHCTYKSCGKVIEPTDNRCEDDKGNPFCSREHRGRERYRLWQLPQEHSILARTDKAEVGAAIVVIIVALVAVLLLFRLTGG